MRHLRLIVIASLLISSGVLLWPALPGLFNPPPEPPPPATNPPATQYYDYYIEDFVLVGQDRSGQPYRLTAKRMERYNDRDLSELFEPSLTQSLSDPPRTISAERGQLSHREKLLVLEDEVVLVRGPPGGRQEITTSHRMKVELR